MVSIFSWYLVRRDQAHFCLVEGLAAFVCGCNRLSLFFYTQRTLYTLLWLPGEATVHHKLVCYSQATDSDKTQFIE
jgi:hypothetical protein